MGLPFGCSALHGKENAISDVERGDGAFVPFTFPWFQYLLTNRNNLLTIRNICSFFSFGNNSFVRVVRYIRSTKLNRKQAKIELLDAATEIGRTPVSKHRVQAKCGE